MEDINRQRMLIRAKKAELNLGNAAFAQACGLDGGTIQKFLHGTTIRLTERAKTLIDRNFSLGLSESVGVARSELGSYSRTSVDLDISGTYKTIRMSPSERNAYYAYETEITWSEQDSCLIFCEKNRSLKNQHSGNVAIFPFSNILHLFTSSKNGHGYRLINVKRNVSDKKMSGFVLTLFDPDLIPMVSPIVFSKDLTIVEFGTVRAGDIDFDLCKREIANCLRSDRSKLLLPDEFQQ